MDSIAVLQETLIKKNNEIIKKNKELGKLQEVLNFVLTPNILDITNLVNYAMKQNNIEVLKYLIEYDYIGDLELDDKLMIGVQANDLEFIKEIVENMNMNLDLDIIQEAIDIAAEYKNLDIINYLTPILESKISIFNKWIPKTL